MSALDVLANFLREKVGEIRPLFVALDGRSGVGKSTLAAQVARTLHPLTVAVIEGDDFYAGGSGKSWDRRSAREKATAVIDWQRQHHLLRQLRQQGQGTYRVFDWQSETWDAEPVPLKAEPRRCKVADIVILEGAYSGRPELAEVIDVRILLTLGDEARRQRLRQREGEAYRIEWEARWAEAEQFYFGEIMPPHRFDLVIDHIRA